MGVPWNASALMVRIPWQPVMLCKLLHFWNVPVLTVVTLEGQAIETIELIANAYAWIASTTLRLFSSTA